MSNTPDSNAHATSPNRAVVRGDHKAVTEDIPPAHEVLATAAYIDDMINNNIDLDRRYFALANVA